MRRTLTMIVLCLILCQSISALDIRQEQEHQFGLDKLESAVPEQAREYLEDNSPYELTDWSNSLWRIFLESLGAAGSASEACIHTCAVVLMVAALTGVFSLVAEGIAARAVTMAGLLATTTAVGTGVSSLVKLSANTIREVVEFQGILLPVMAAAGTAAGSPGASAAVYSGTVLFTNFLMKLATKILFPLVFAGMALSLGNGALHTNLLQRLQNALNKLLTWGLKGIVTVFSAVLALTGVVRGTADAAMVKATKMAVSGMVPVVGSILADASETVLASATVIQACTGVFGLLVIAAICLKPFFEIGLQYLLLKITTSLCAMIAIPELVAHLENLSKAAGYLLAITGIFSFMSLISCVCFLQMGVG